MNLKSLSSNQKGSATIYLVITFTALILTVGILIDLARIRIVKHQLRTSSDSAVRSVLANYNSQLRGTFGLFARETYDYQKEYAKYLKNNLPSYQKDYLFSSKYERSYAFLANPLSDPVILKSQILEDMKYKAPVDFFRELADKLNKVNNLSSFFQKSNKISKYFVALNNFLKDMHESNVNIKKDRDIMIQAKTEIASLKKQLAKEDDLKTRKSITGKIAKLNKAVLNMVKDIEKELKRSERVALEFEMELNKLKRFMDTPDRKFNKNQEIKMEDKSVNNSINKQIKEYESAILIIKQEIKKSKVIIQSQKDDYKNLKVIGIEEASKMYEKVNGSMDKPYQGNTYDSFLKKEVNSMYQNFEFSKYFEPFNLGGKPGNNEANEKSEDITAFLKATSNAVNLNSSIYNLRDEIYIDQYVLKYFSNLTTEPKGDAVYHFKNTEAEYICFGQNPAMNSVSQLYFTRFALDSMAYFAFSKAPVEILQRMFYSLTMGALQAVSDTYKLIAKKENVPIANMGPQNPLKEITLNYTDHLRLFLLLKSDEEGKLQRIAQLIHDRNQFECKNLYTDVKGESTVSIRLWFIPSIGLGNMNYGPFGTKVTGGRCYITKQAEFGY